MLWIEDMLVSDAVVEEQFFCQLEACRGACCWEGDWGAPLEDEELDTLEAIYPEIRPFLTHAGRQAIDREGPSTYFEAAGAYGTTLLPDGACAFMTRDERGIAQCGIEQAWRAGATDFRKPISCHLYPIRVTHDARTGLQVLNYDRWDICSAACALGREKAMPVYRFVREALIRRYGQGFYQALEAAAGRQSEGSDG